MKYISFLVTLLLFCTFLSAETTENVENPTPKYFIQLGIPVFSNYSIDPEDGNFSLDIDSTGFSMIGNSTTLNRLVAPSFPSLSFGVNLNPNIYFVGGFSYLYAKEKGENDNYSEKEEIKRLELSAGVKINVMRNDKIGINIVPRIIHVNAEIVQDNNDEGDNDISLNGLEIGAQLEYFFLANVSISPEFNYRYMEDDEDNTHKALSLVFNMTGYF